VPRAFGTAIDHVNVVNPAKRDRGGGNFNGTRLIATALPRR
jgi:hypothetical protein